MAEYFFDQRIRNDIKTYEKTRKIDYTSDCLLDYKLIAIDLSKQQALLHAVSRVIKQINFTVNLDHVGDATIFFILQESRETILDFSQECFSRNGFFHKSFVNILL